MRKLEICLAAGVAAASIAFTASGCGGANANLGGPHPDYRRALAGSPAPLASLHEQANRLLPGGLDAYEKRLASLRGYPVVVNFWASWCGDCRYEFPYLQKASAAYGMKVAFLGVDNEDSEAHARAFLGEEPVPYPSYADSGSGIAESVGATVGLPDTAFYDAGGKLVYLKQGVYASAADLRADVRRYALGEGPKSG